MVDALHVAARRNDLAGVEGSLRHRIVAERKCLARLDSSDEIAVRSGILQMAAEYQNDFTDNGIVTHLHTRPLTHHGELSETVKNSLAILG